MDGWYSPTIFKRPVNNILTLLTSVLVVCISAVLACVLIWHDHLQALFSTIILASASQVAEARLTQKVICSNPVLTAFASIVSFIGVMVWTMVYCRQLTLLWDFQYNRTCTLFTFLLNTHFYVPIKVKCLSGHRHMYKLQFPITHEQMLYTKSFLLDTINFTRENMSLHMNGHLVDLPLSVFVPLKNKIRACCMVAKNRLDLQSMIKQRTNWYSLTKTAESK